MRTAPLSVHIAAKIIVFRHGHRSLEFAQRMRRISKRKKFADAVVAEIKRMATAPSRA